jgi:ceramide glucosyltransferase
VPEAIDIVVLVVVAASFAGMAYQLTAAVQLRRFLSGPRPRPKGRPAISVLKPLCGDEPGLYDNLHSFAVQDYPSVQLVFGVSEAQDRALGVVRQVSDETRSADLAVVVDPAQHGCNLKVGNLLNMLPQARHDVLVMADSDVRVVPGYLDDVVAGLERPGVGLVTCLYVGRPDHGPWDKLGAMGINHGFLPSALVARALGRRDGCFGATIAIRRADLLAVGGLEPLRDILADDWALGDAVRRAGWSIGLAARPVDLMVREPDFKSLLAHEIRWGRTIAAVDRPSYVASLITQPVVLALLAAIVGGPPYLLLVLLASLIRLQVVRAEERMLAVPKSSLALVAAREVLTFVVWVAGCCGRSVLWRGKRFRIRRGGRLEMVEGVS